MSGFCNFFVEIGRFCSDFDEFSSSVSLYGNSVLVGAQYDDDLGISSGSAYIFTYKGCSDLNACNYDETFIIDNS